MSAERDALVHRMRDACVHPDAAAFRAFVHPAVVALVESGRDMIVGTLPISGVDRVIPVLLDVVSADCRVSAQGVNGVLGLVIHRDSRVIGIMSLDMSFDDVAEGLIIRVWITLDPLKLQRWNS